MSYTATVLDVMIASPADVIEERQIIRDVVYEWNVLHSKANHLVLLARGWETHATPSFGRSPQDTINVEVLEDADLLIGVFWTRLGTATAKHVSGTVEEIERHVAAGKAAMLYFSNAPVPPDDIDAEQHAAVMRFRESCKGRGLYQTYNDRADFRNKFAHQLTLKVTSLRAALPSAQELAARPGHPHVTFDQATAAMLTALTRTLLSEAAKTNAGQIIRRDLDQALVVQVNGRTFEAFLNNGRFRAEIESAISELIENGLLEDVVGGRRLLQLTSKGFRIAQLLERDVSGAA